MEFGWDGPADARVLVLANSLAASCAMWNAQCGAWSGRWRLLRFNDDGHAEPGRSPPRQPRF